LEPGYFYVLCAIEKKYILTVKMFSLVEKQTHKGLWHDTNKVHKWSGKEHASQ